MYLGVALAILASLCFVGFDAARKRLSKLDALAVTGGLSLFQAIPFCIWWLVDHFIVGGGGADESPWPRAAYWPVGGVDLLLNVLAGVLFVRSVALSPFSRTIPLLSLSPVFATVGAVLVLGEIPSLGQLGGIVMAVSGALWINADRADRSGFLPLVTAVYRERGSFLMVLVAMCWALTVVLDKECLKHAEESAHATIQTAGVGLVLAFVLVSRGKAAALLALAKHPGEALAAIVLGSTALGVQLLALQFLFAAVVETIKRAIGVTASLVVGRLVFGEPVTSYKLLGAALIVLGTTLLALAG